MKVVPGFLQNMIGKITGRAPQPKPSAPTEMSDRSILAKVTQLWKGKEQADQSHETPSDWSVKTCTEYEIGDIIENRYLVEKKFQGAMGFVYIGLDPTQNVRFAIKQPKQEVLYEQEFYTRVIKEADAWTALGMHQNIAYCYFVRNIEQVPHIFVEFVNGGDLSQWIKRKKCQDYQVALNFGIQFCHGMEKAHAKGMVHRDIKSENILMTKDGTLKVTDFGLVGKSTQGTKQKNQNVQTKQLGDSNTTMLGAMMGTPAYMSPEQKLDPRQKSDQAPDGVWFDSDVYSFGVCLWEMLLNKRPYPSTVELIQTPPPDPRKFRPQLPRSLAKLLLDVVHLDRTKRPQTFEELRHRLNDIYREIYHTDAPNYQIRLYDTAGDELNNQGYSYYELGKKSDAIESFQKGIEAESTHPQCTYNLGLLQWQKHEIDDAEILRRLDNCATNPTVDKQILAELKAQVHLERHDLDSAQACLEKFPERYQALLGDRSLDNMTCLQTLEAHTGAVMAVDIVGDGKFILSASQDKTVKLWNLEKAKCLRTFTGHTDRVNVVKSIADSRFAASGSDDKTIRLWDIESGECVKILEGHNGEVYDLVILRAGHQILSTGKDKSLRLWDVHNGKCLKNMGGSDWYSQEHTDEIYAIGVSSDSNRAYTASGDRTLKIWDLQAGKSIATLKGHRYEVNTLAASSDDWILASGGEDKLIYLWNIDSQQNINVLKGHKDAVHALTIAKHSQYIVSGGGENDKSLKLWHVDSGRCLRTLTGHTAGINDLVLLEDKNLVISASSDHSIRVWQLTLEMDYHAALQLSLPKSSEDIAKEQKMLDYAMTQIQTLCNEKQYKNAYILLYETWNDLNFRNDETILNIYKQLKRYARVKGVAFVNQLRLFEGHKDQIHSVGIDKTKQWIYSGSYDRTVKKWNLNTGKIEKSFKPHHGPLNSISVSETGQWLLTGGSDSHPVKLWNLEDQSEDSTKILEGHAHFVKLVSISQNASKGASFGWDNNIKIWDLEKAECGHTIGGKNDLTSMTISPNGEFVIIGERTGVIYIMNAKSGRPVHSLERDRDRHRAAVSALVVSSDGNWLASGGADKTIRLWRMETGEQMVILKGHTDTITSLLIIGHGQFIISGSADETIRIWNAREQQCIKTLEGHTACITDLAMSADAELLVSASQDKTLRLWRIVWDLKFRKTTATLTTEDSL